MPAITFIHPNGERERIDAATAKAPMLAATKHGLDGIVAECGGNAMCATCHVYVDQTWLARLPPMADEEDALLDGTAPSGSPTAACPVRSSWQRSSYGLVLRLSERQI